MRKAMWCRGHFQAVVVMILVCIKNICAGNKVFLDGDLERGIVPEDSVWMHGGGNGEDGCLLLLRKMNLELLRRWGPYPVGAPCAFFKRGV